jgi:hypothetical protein
MVTILVCFNYSAGGDYLFISIILLGLIRSRKYRSWVTTITVPENSRMAFSRASRASISRWFDGSSSKRQLG